MIGDKNKKYKEIDALLEKAKESVAAREMLVMTFKPMVLNMVKKYCYNHGEFEDWYQEGQVILLKAIQDFNPRLGVYFQTYCKSQLFYAFVEKRKREVKENKNHGSSLDYYNVQEGTGLKDVIEDTKTNVELEVMRHIDDGNLMKLILQLNQIQRTIIWNHYARGHSLAEIALQIKKPKHWVYREHKFILKKMRVCYDNLTQKL